MALGRAHVTGGFTSTSLLGALDDLDKTPTLGGGQRTGLHDANGVANAGRVLLVVDVEFLGAGHHLAVLGMTLALRGGHNNALVALSLIHI